MAKAMYAKTAGEWQQVYPNPSRGIAPVLSGDPSATQVVYTWTAATGIVPLSYEFEFDGVVTDVGNVLTLTKTGLTSGQAHTARVRAKAAYSLRGEWSNTVNVTAFDPSSLSECILWFDPTDNAKVTVAGGLVTSITSKIASPAITLSTIPASHTAPTDATINGKRALGFNGSKGIGMGANTLLNGAAGYSVYMVANATAGVAFARALMLNSSGGVTRARISIYPNVDPWTVDVRTSASGTPGSVVVDSVAAGRRVVSSRGTGGASNSVARGNVSTADVALSNQASITAFEGVNSVALNLGTRGDVATQCFAGQIGEIILYSRRLTDSENTQVLDYLAAKWGVV